MLMLLDMFQHFSTIKNKYSNVNIKNNGFSSWFIENDISMLMCCIGMFDKLILAYK